MNRTDKALIILLDEGAPVSAGEPFRARGHRVIQHAEVLPNGARDQEVAAAAIANEAILIATDKDMRAFVRRFGAPNGSEYFPGLSLIHLNDLDVHAESRLRGALSFVEHEWAYTIMKKARRLWIDVGLHRLTTYR